MQTAVVTLNSGATCTTGGAGGCTLQNVPIGEHNVTVTADGFEEYTNTVTISNAEPLDPFILTPE